MYYYIIIIKIIDHIKKKIYISCQRLSRRIHHKQNYDNNNNFFIIFMNAINTQLKTKK